MLRVKNLRALAQGAGLLVLGVAVAGASVYAWSNWQHHFWAAQRGPTEITLEELANIDQPGDLPNTWLKVQFDKAYDTKMGDRQTKDGRTVVVDKYLLVEVGDRWLIAIVPPGFGGDTLSGQAWHAEGTARNETVAAIQSQLDNVHHGRLLPFELHAETDYGQTWTYFGIVMAMFGATGGLFSCLGLASVYRGMFGPAPVTEDEFEKRATVQVDAAIARIFQSAGSGKAAK